MSRRGENIYKRKDGRWEGRYIKARNEHGKITYGYVYGKKYTIVKNRLAELRVQYIGNYSNLTLYDGTVEQWMSYWLAKFMNGKIKISTYSTYKTRMEKYIFPVLGSKKLINLTSTHIQEFIFQLENLGLSSRSINVICLVLKSALNQAVKESYIVKNPCEDITIKKKEYTNINALSIEQQRRIEKRALFETECSAAIIALYTGMRIGEISGLRWEDIDFERNLLCVRRTLTRISSLDERGKTQIIMSSPKTKTSERSIPLATNLRKYLLKKKKLSISDYVISCKDGFAEPRVINYRFKKLLEEEGLDNIKFHSLRHTFATRCIEKGADIATVSKLLGHSSTKMTLDIYADSLWESRTQVISNLDKMLEGG
ncbi:tyrosine-type recombinase/integrase [Enterococcus sp. LJL128]|uniref:tyrosine-type recombinase/integrase n=1 Tax=Enterococcus sp. LJL51 TaxID=3416656 RepID=UPI003CEB10A5